MNSGYFRVNYDDENWKTIIDVLNSRSGGDFFEIPKINRAQLLDDSFNLARAGYLNFDTALNLLNYLHQEYELEPLVAGFRTIEFLMEFLDEQNFYQELRDHLVDIVEKIYLKTREQHQKQMQNGNISRRMLLTRLHVNQFACRIGAKSCLEDVSSSLFLMNLEFANFDVEERPFLYCGSVGSDIAQFYWYHLKNKIVETNEGNDYVYRAKQEEMSEIFDAFSLCDKNLDQIERTLIDIFIEDPDKGDSEKEDKTPRYDYVTYENAFQVVDNLISSSSAGRSLVMKFYNENFDAMNEK